VTLAISAPGGLVRLATPGDNAALIELTTACPMEGDLSLCIDRAPEFFALNRLEGDRWRVAVVDSTDRRAIACVATAERRVWLHGKARTVVYAGDLKVHPDYRDARTADALERFVTDTARDTAGDATPVYLTILGGNAAMERRVDGPRGLPRLQRFATLNAFAIPLLWSRPVPDGADLRVEAATEAHLEEMADLWSSVAPTRQFAPVMDAERLARDRNGRLRGFMGVWDQRALKTLRVLRYSPSLSVLRGVMSALAPLVGAAAPPAIGKPLHYASAMHLCVPSDRVDVMRALVLAAYNRLHRTDRVFLNVALDVRDPLVSALDGMLATPTVVHAYATMPGGTWTGGALDDRPLHFESALV
jgi:hypothetical protein